MEKMKVKFYLTEKTAKALLATYAVEQCILWLSSRHHEWLPTENFTGDYCKVRMLHELMQLYADIDDINRTHTPDYVEYFERFRRIGYCDLTADYVLHALAHGSVEEAMQYGKRLPCKRNREWCIIPD